MQILDLTQKYVVRTDPFPRLKSAVERNQSIGDARRAGLTVEPVGAFELVLYLVLETPAKVSEMWDWSSRSTFTQKTRFSTIAVAAGLM